MPALKWIIAALALLNAGYMTFDGGRALLTGDYIRPQSGEYAGQLGPWHNLVSAIGIDPESTLMKSIFVIYGLLGLFITACYIMGYPRSATALLLYNIAALWYLVMGTASSIIQIILLLIIRFLRQP